MLLKVTAFIYLDAPDGVSLDAIGASFESGLEQSVADYPGAEVVQADVESVERVSDEEAAEKGLVE